MIALLKNEHLRLALMLAISMLAHAVLLSIQFTINRKPPPAPPPALEVVLVNAKTETPPEQTEVLAQANLDRGGNSENALRVQTPLPAESPRPPETPQPVAKKHRETGQFTPRTAAKLQQQRLTDLEKQAREIMTQIKSKQAIEEPSNSSAPAPEQDQTTSAAKTSGATDLVIAGLDAARLEAEISKDWENYQKRPKRKFLGGRAMEFKFAAYIENWRQKVEKIGNLNYPEEAKQQKLYGQLRMTVSIRADGSVEKIELNKSSGHKVLDDAARRIVELAAPYAPFPEEIRRDAEILDIVRTWTFTREDALATQ